MASTNDNKAEDQAQGYETIIFYGTQSDGTITAILVDSDGKIQTV